MRFLRGFGRFWYDFIVGDDWRIAAGVLGVLAAGGVTIAVGVDGWWLAPGLGLGLVLVFAAPLLATRRSA